MAYKISGSKSDLARVIILKESDWSIESNTIISGSGSYEIDSVTSGTKSIIARNDDGYVLGYGNVESVYYEEEVPESETVIFYWNSQNSSDWTNPNNMVDGNNTTTYANVTDGGSSYFYQVNNTNTSSDQGGAITKVEIRIVYSYNPQMGMCGIGGYPVFNGSTDGSLYSFSIMSNPAGGPYTSEWHDITEDGEAPETWTWSDLTTLDLKIRGIADHGVMPMGTYVGVYKCDMQVTYTPS